MVSSSEKQDFSSIRNRLYIYWEPLELFGPNLINGKSLKALTS